MAKKKTTKKTVRKTTKKSTVRGGAVSKQRDKETIGKIESLATSVAKAGLAQREPKIEIPIRSVNNMKYNPKKRILEMGSSTQQRELFNAGQARKFMQMLLVSKGCKDLIQAEKTLSLRGMYYMSLHTIEGTSEKTFNEQSPNPTPSSRILRSPSTVCGRNSMSSPRSVARWSATSRSSTTAMRSTVAEWEPGATPFRASASRA